MAEVPNPVALAGSTAQYAVRTPSEEKKEGYYYAVLFTTRLDLAMQQVWTTTTLGRGWRRI